MNDVKPIIKVGLPLLVDNKQTFKSNFNLATPNEQEFLKEQSIWKFTGNGN